MAFDPKAALFAVVILAFAASFGYSGYLFVKMIREVNKVEGHPGRIPWSLILWRGRLVHRHADVCPAGGSTRALHLVLSIIGGVLLVWACVLWNG